MPSAATIAAFAAASLLLLLIPGPAVLYIVNRSVSDGQQAGLAAVAGLSLGNLVHALAAAVGLSAVLATSAAAFNTVKWLGAGYLIYVGVRTLMRPAAAIDPDQPGVSARRSFTQGVVVNVLNPKVALFFLAFLPQFVSRDAVHPALAMAVLGAIFCLNGTLWCLFVAWSAARLARRAATETRLAALLEASGGALMLWLAARLALSEPR